MLASPARLPAGPWQNPFRLNLPAPPVLPPPEEDEAAAHEAGKADEIAAPMPGTVIRVLVAPGDEVEARATLAVIEAMKMEMPLQAPRAGRVRAVNAAEGDTVARGAILVELDD